MKLTIQLLALVLLYVRIDALDNGLALTPPMGWMSWERFRCNTDCKNDPDNCISEGLYKAMADRMVSDGYLEAGYNQVNIDDCWMAMKRDGNGKLVADPDRFPSGIKALADYMHKKGLKLGIYESMSYETCKGFPGSYEHITTDAKTFAEWGVDMVKMDKCHDTPGVELKQEGFINMSIALNKTGRPMIYSCEWPKAKGYPDVDLIGKYCNSWRNFADIQDSWPSMLAIMDYMIANEDKFFKFSKPGSYNDPDMLIIGDFSLSYEQAKSQMALWSIMAAQMMMSNDLRTIGLKFKEILLNKEVIAVNQDKLGIMGKKFMTTSSKIEVWTKPLDGQSFAVVFFSRATDQPRLVTVTPSQIGFKHPAGYIMYELFDHQHLGHFMPNEKLSFKVNPNGAVMLRGDPAHGNTKLQFNNSNTIY